MVICLIQKEEKVPSSCASLLARLQDLACCVRDQAVSLQPIHQGSSLQGVGEAWHSESSPEMVWLQPAILAPSPPLPSASLLLPLLRFSYQLTFQIGLQPVTLLEKMIM